MKLINNNLIIISFCILIFTLAALFRIYYNDYSSIDLGYGYDDWDRYFVNAVDIKDNGLLIKNVEENYLMPSGFLYNYFLAFCFLIFGINLSVVYFIQSAILGFSIAVTFIVFKDFMSKKISSIFLFSMIIFAFIDIFKHYTFRLLSENIALLTIPLFLFFLKKTLLLNKNIKTLYFVTGLFLGISVLIRPNIFPFSLVFLSLVLMFIIFNKSQLLSYFYLIASYLIIMSLLPLRNYFVTGELSVLPVDGDFIDYIKRENNLSFTEDFINYMSFYYKKIIYIFGFLNNLESEFNDRPHWMIMWLGYFIYIFSSIKRIVKERNFEIFIHVFIFMFYLIIVLIAPITDYGFRIIIPLLFLVLGFSIIGYKKLYYFLKSILFNNTFIKKKQ
jgi:hypothetical protein